MSQLNVLIASAGSGKTHRITFEFIKSILPDPNNAGRILAITFTNKAAGEMKSRIIEELSLLANQTGQSKMEPDLKKDLNLTTEDIKSKAKTALSHILHHYSELSVSTIDAFIQRIIRTFSRDLGLASDYEVLVDNSEMTEYIIDNIIDQVNVQKELTAVFKQVIERNIDDDKLSLSFKENLRGIVNNLGKESSDNFIQEALSYNTPEMIGFLKKAYVQVSAQRKKINEGLALFDKICSDQNLTVEDFVSHSRVSIWGEMVKIKSDPQKYSAAKSVDKLLGEKGILINENEALESEIKDLYLSLKSAVEKFGRMQVLIQDFPFVAIIAEILRIREDFKTSEGILPVSDFYTLIASVLAKEPVPFIFLRAGNRYKTIMIDEFQDTSLMQWINLTSLIHNSLASGNRNWLVGDPKQSIYRWRNGEMEIMLSLPRIYSGGRQFEILDDAAPLFDSAFNPDRLPTNYRSDKNIVDFNNGFFAFLQKSIIGNHLETSENKNLITPTEKEEYLKVYADVKQDPHKKDGGYIEIRFNEEYNTELLHAQIEKLIRRKLEQGFKLNDIAILCRNNKHGVAISNFLLNLPDPIQVISEETLQFQSSYYCRLAMNILRVLSSEKDKLAHSEFRSLMLQFPDDNLQTIYQKHYKTNTSAPDFIYAQWPGLKPGKSTWYSPSELLTLIIHNLELSGKGEHYLIFLREKVLEQERKSGSDFESMYTWWQEKGRTMSVVTPAGSNAVNIMSLHKSKGLQFPVVIMPDFNFNDFKSIHWNLHWFRPGDELDIPFTAVKYAANTPVDAIKQLHEKELLKTLIDSINLIYVGCTRAENELFVLSDIKEKEKLSEKPKPGAMLYHFLENNTDENHLQIEFNDADGVYKYGSEKIIAKSEDKDCAFELKDFHAAHPHAYKEESDDYDSELLRESALEGRIWHEILSKFESAENAEKLIQQYVLNGQISHQAKNESIEFLKKIAGRHADLFPSDAVFLSERDLTDEKGFIHRPDRILKQGESYTVIDFKTGTPKESHKKQIAEYRDILISMGLNVSRTCLLYLRPGEGESEVVDI